MKGQKLVCRELSLSPRIGNSRTGYSRCAAACTLGSDEIVRVWPGTDVKGRTELVRSAQVLQASTCSIPEETLGERAQNGCLGNQPSDFFLRMSEEYLAWVISFTISLRDFLWWAEPSKVNVFKHKPSRRNRRAPNRTT
jgi:hypothetical protein